ncbi:MAG: hypothetical protein ACJ8AI_20245 [Rhodopila sp.]
MANRATKRVPGHTALKSEGSAEPALKRGRGRPPKHGEAMSGRERQALYTRQRQRDMAEVAYALKKVLERFRANQTAFCDIYQGTTSGERLRRGLARLLNDTATDDPAEQETMRETLAFFDDLIPSDSGRR